MSKRQIIVESITECVVNSNNVSVWVKIHDTNPATVNLTSKNNAGGEAWEWAQSHWPEFVPEEKEVTLTSSSGKPVKVKGTVRWVCVTGILDAKTKKSLPIEELRAGDDSHRRWGARTKGQKVEPVKVKETSTQTTHKTHKQKTTVIRKDKLGSGHKKVSDELGDVDLQGMYDDKLREVLEDEAN